VHGGKFWRITPMINWYMTRSLRTEFAYGYGQLDRFGLQGNVSLFQARFQLTVM
jgi:phosphate-selective porin OprO/OprP